MRDRERGKKKQKLLLQQQKPWRNLVVRISGGTGKVLASIKLSFKQTVQCISTVIWWKTGKYTKKTLKYEETAGWSECYTCL